MTPDVVPLEKRHTAHLDQDQCANGRRHMACTQCASTMCAIASNVAVTEYQSVH